MNYLLTGNQGYIGSRLEQALLKKHKWMPETLYFLDKKNPRENINELYTIKENPDAVWHLAAQAGAMPSWDDPYQDAMDNIMATIRICKLFPDAKLIFTTSGAALDPESPYGLSKRTAEDYIRMLHPNAVILRLSSVYGEKDRGVVDTFVREDKCVIYGDGSAVRDFVHVDDIVEALIKAKDWEPGTYTLGSGVGTTVKEIAEATGKPIEYMPARKGEKQEVVLDNNSPNWKPKINVIDYVREIRFPVWTKTKKSNPHI